MKLLFFITLLTLLYSQTLVFRLDDVQCWWMEENSFDIIQLFMNYKIPLSIGIITVGGVDCFLNNIPKWYYSGEGLLDVDSHSVTHADMTRMTINEQTSEACDSKRAIESFLGNGTVRTFFPPFNKWNYDTVTALVNCGYDLFSCECTGVDVWQTGGEVCTVSMYYNRPSFFYSIDGLTHIPIGASIAPFGGYDTLLSLDQIFNGTLEDCYEGNCSIGLQMSAMPLFTTNGDPDQIWAALMMHPFDFPENWGYRNLENWFVPLFQRAVASGYQIKNFTGFAGPKGSRPFVVGEKV